MRILHYELRKIWRFPIVLAIAVLGVMVYFGFMHSTIYGSQLQLYPIPEYRRISCEWAEKYGAYMDESEYEDAQTACMVLRQKAEAQIAACEPLAAHGITTLKQFISFWSANPGYNDNPSEEAPALRDVAKSAVLAYETSYLLSGYHGWYNSYNENFLNGNECYREYPGLTPTETARLDEAIGEQRLRGISSIRKSDLDGYLIWVNIYAVLSTALLLVSCGAREWLNRMQAEQWTTHTGRRVIRYRLAAALISAVGLFLLEALVFGGLYCASQLKMFWGNPMTSFVSGDILWLDLTCGEYLLTFAAVMCFLMLGTAGAVFVLSHISSSYISALLRAGFPVVLYAAAGGFAASSPFTWSNHLYQLTRMIGIEIILCASLCVSGLAVSLLPLFLDRRKELL